MPVAVSIGYDLATIGLGWLVVWAALRSSCVHRGGLLLHNAAIAQQLRQLGDVGGDAPGLVIGEELRRLPLCPCAIPAGRLIAVADDAVAD